MPDAEPIEVAAPADAPDAAAPVEVGLRPNWSLFPVAGVDSDDGVGFGVRGQLDMLKPGTDPYKSSFVIHLFTTTQGYHHHRFKFDLVDLGPAGNLRLTGHFAFRAWLNDGYWGLGNGSVHDPSYDDLGKDDPLRKYYHYQLIQPFAHVTLRDDVTALGPGSLLVYGSWEGRYSIINPYPGSLLEHEQPYGVAGGPAMQLTAGVLWDSRSPEITPDKGALVEVSGRALGMLDGDTWDPSAFGGPMVSLRGYVPVVPRLTWASRIMGEWLLGRVPFYEMVQWGGFVPIAGVGGSDTLRGASFGRWHGPGKAVLQDELRIDVLEHRFLKKSVRWQLAPFADVATVWGLAQEDPALLGAATVVAPRVPLHPAGGLGVRGIWGETLVGRFDVGLGQDIVPGGYGRSLGFYLAFDHAY